jgi:rfaE bifunctional protein nucleotidyltransferase chain/domain
MSGNLALSGKIVDPHELPGIRERTRSGGEKVVLCHGIFDLIHPGHVGHLQRAKDLGDLLVVSVTPDRYVDRGPGRPVFSEDVRLSMLAALGCVDWVTLTEGPDAIGIIDALRPDYYCKGQGDAARLADPTSALSREVDRVTEHGGDVQFVGGAVYSSTTLLSDHFDVMPAPVKAFSAEFRGVHGMDSIQSALAGMEDLRVLVVGDVIIDEYVYTEFQGITSKDHAPSVRYRNRQRQWGGAFAVARHLSGVCRTVTLAGIAGPEEELTLAAPPPGAPEEVDRVFEVDPHSRTVIKRRFVVENRLQDTLHKVFSVNHVVAEDAIRDETRERFRESLTALMSLHDVILVADYGHGLLDPTARALVERDAPWLALNCQTNTANFGFNLITKYHRADSFSVDEAELALAFRDRGGPREPLLQRLRAHLSASGGWLTRGAAGSVAVGEDNTLRTTPAFTTHVKDTIGAGDAYFALASAAFGSGAPLEVAAFLGNVAGALAANTVGNTSAIKKHQVLRLASTVVGA